MLKTLRRSEANRERDQRRQRTLEAARLLYSINPTEAIGLDQLADAAEVERTWVYRHYGNREALFREVARRWLDVMGEIRAVEVDLSGGVLSYLKRQCDVVERALATPDHVDLVRVILREGRRDDWLTESYDRRLSELARTIEGRIRDAGMLIGVPLGLKPGAAIAFLTEATHRVTCPLLWPNGVQATELDPWRDACIARLAQSAFPIEDVLLFERGSGRPSSPAFSGHQAVPGAPARHD